jgi:hypothetical protein
MIAGSQDGPCVHTRAGVRWPCSNGRRDGGLGGGWAGVWARGMARRDSDSRRPMGSY